MAGFCERQKFMGAARYRYEASNSELICSLIALRTVVFTIRSPRTDYTELRCTVRELTIAWPRSMGPEFTTAVSTPIASCLREKAGRLPRSSCDAPAASALWFLVQAELVCPLDPQTARG